MKQIDSARYKIDSPISLGDLPTHPRLKLSESKIEQSLHHTRRTLSELQEVVYAQGRFSVLIILQGMDTSGKDSLIREVFKDFNARGVAVHSFKKPTEAEHKQDYLWRHY